MASLKSPQIYRLAAAILAIMLAACSKPDERQAGVDDFPNTIQAQVQGFLAESRKAEEIGAVPGLADTILGLQGFNVADGKTGSGKTGAGKTGAGKTAAGMASTGIISASAKVSTGFLPVMKVATPITCQGTLKFDTTVSGPVSTTVNTLILCVDTGSGNGAVLRGRSVTTYFGNEKVDSTEISDADGDGKLNPLADGSSRARLSVSSRDGKLVDRTVLVAGPGPDNDFDTEADNVIFAAGWIKLDLPADDTLGMATYSDADGDGSVLDNGKASLVDLIMYEKGASQEHPDARWSRANLRLNVRYGQEPKEAKRVHFEMETTDGRIQSADLLNTAGDPDFNQADTIQARFQIAGTAPTDTLDSLETILLMKVGPSLEDKSDDSIYAMHVKVKKKLGAERSARFAFESDLPLASGQEPRTGKISMAVEYSDASTLEVDGKLSKGFLDVDVKTQDGKRLHVVWDPLGRPVSLEEIP